MNNTYEIRFMQSDIVDVSSLIYLLKSEGFEIEYSPIKGNNMGIDLLLLTILLPQAISITNKLLDVLTVWLQNRSVEIVVKNQKTQKELTIISKRGKMPTKEELDSIKLFLR